MTLEPKASNGPTRPIPPPETLGDPDQVASLHAEDGEVVINRGEPHAGRAAVSAMAAGCCAVVPDLRLTCDTVRVADSHAAFLWTYPGHDSETRNPLSVAGCEECDMNEDLKVTASRGWFDAEDYAGT